MLYDQLSDHWMLSQFAFASQTAAPYHQCIAISKTPDPTGAYFLYDFITSGNEFPDYPHLGVWPDGYYMMVHQFTLGGPFNGTGVYAFNRLKMLTGDPTANYIYFNLNLASHAEGIGGSLPSEPMALHHHRREGQTLSFTLPLQTSVIRPRACGCLISTPTSTLHKMRDVTVNYTATDNCPGVNCVLSVSSNEPVNGTGDGDTSPDWEIVDNHHVRLRAERAGSGSGRKYTITVTCTDAAGNVTTKSTTVIVAHNIGSPVSGAAFKINTPVNFAGTFWDVGGKTHTGQFIVDSTTIPGTVVEPKGLANGSVKATYTFITPGVYTVSRLPTTAGSRLCQVRQVILRVSS